MRRVQGAERWISALVVLPGLAGLLALSWKSPQAWGIPPCPFLFLTGFFCPGCGTLRAVHSLLHGDLLQAIGFNPLLILLLPYFGFVGANEALSLITGRKWTGSISPRWGPRWGWTIFSIILAFWILRNLPGEAFDFLRPGKSRSPLRGMLEWAPLPGGACVPEADLRSAAGVPAPFPAPLPSERPAHEK